MNLTYLGWLLAVIMASVLFVIATKYYTLSSNENTRVTLFLSTLLASIVIFVAYVNLFSTRTVSLTYALTKIGSVIVVLAVGVLLFQERLTWKNGLGVVLAVGAIWLLS